MKQSPLELLRYLVPEISCSANPNFDPNKECEGGRDKYTVEAAVIRQESQKDAPGHSWSVEMTISQKLEEGQNFPYEFEITIVGFFTCLEGLPPAAEEERFVRVNGSSLLYGAARELV